MKVLRVTTSEVVVRVEGYPTLDLVGRALRPLRERVKDLPKRIVLRASAVGLATLRKQIGESPSIHSRMFRTVCDDRDAAFEFESYGYRFVVVHSFNLAPSEFELRAVIDSEEVGHE